METDNEPDITDSLGTEPDIEIGNPLEKEDKKIFFCRVCNYSKLQVLWFDNSTNYYLVRCENCGNLMALNFHQTPKIKTRRNPRIKKKEISYV